MNNKGFVKIIVILALAIVGVGVYLVVGMKKSDISGNGAPISEGEFNFYENDEAGISFYYPKEWKVVRERFGYDRAACDDPSYPRDGSCRKSLNLVLGAPDRGEVEFGGRQCRNVVEIAEGYAVCYSASNSPDASFSNDESTFQKYANDGTKKGVEVIRSTFKKFK